WLRHEVSQRNNRFSLRSGWLRTGTAFCQGSTAKHTGYKEHRFAYFCSSFGLNKKTVTVFFKDWPKTIPRECFDSLPVFLFWTRQPWDHSITSVFPCNCILIPNPYTIAGKNARDTKIPWL